MVYEPLRRRPTLQTLQEVLPFDGDLVGGGFALQHFSRFPSTPECTEGRPTHARKRDTAGVLVNIPTCSVQ